MLKISEFTVGTLSDAEPLSLVLPTEPNGDTILVARSGEMRLAIFLTGPHAYRCFEYEQNDGYGGIIIPKVEIEVDETTAFADRSVDAPKGVVVRTGTGLTIDALRDQNFGRSSRQIVVAGLPEVRDGQAVGFRRWHICIGEADDKRVLLTVDRTS
jgi:hypothetical protein